MCFVRSVSTVVVSILLCIVRMSLFCIQILVLTLSYHFRSLYLIYWRLTFALFRCMHVNVGPCSLPYSPQNSLFFSPSRSIFTISISSMILFLVNGDCFCLLLHNLNLYKGKLDICCLMWWFSKFLLILSTSCAYSRVCIHGNRFQASMFNSTIFIITKPLSW